MKLVDKDKGMTNQQIIEKVKLWQNAGFVHPLTCGKNSLHLNLVPEERNKKVVLICPSCNYVQDSIPDYVLTTYVEVVKAAMKRAEEPKKVNLSAILVEGKDGNWWLELSSINRESREQFDKMRAKFMYYRDFGLNLVLSEASLSMGGDKTEAYYKIYDGPDISHSEDGMKQLANFKPVTQD